MATKSVQKKVLVLRSSWQVVNIGDIAHSPGVLALLERNFPDVEIILWASAELNQPVTEMLLRRFPRLEIVKGSIGANGRATNQELQTALERCDFLLHGSGPSLVANQDMLAFHQLFHKPFGVFGISYQGNPMDREVLSLAQFIYFRDSASLQRALREGIRAPIMEFGPDGAFSVDLENDKAARAFLSEHGLEAGRFFCVIPRYRSTPYWEIKSVSVDEGRKRYNEEMLDADHRYLREAIVAVVRQGYQVLICPEDMTQVALGKRILFDLLPEDVKPRVVWRDRFWWTDEAISTYRLSAGLFGNEMHSPIMCLGNGIPAIVCRWSEQTTKGQMWADIGLGEWLFDMDNPSQPAGIVAAVLGLINDPQGTRQKVEAAQNRVHQFQAAMCQTLAKALASRI